MKIKFLIRRVLLICISMFLLLLAWVALEGGINQWPRSVTIGQQIETVIQIAFGLLCLLTVISCFWWREWAKSIRIAWGISLVLVAGLSALVWGPPMPMIALVFAVVAALVAIATVRVLQYLTGK